MKKVEKLLSTLNISKNEGAKGNIDYNASYKKVDITLKGIGKYFSGDEREIK